MGKKIVFYLKGGNRSITITDHKENKSLKDLKEEFSGMLYQPNNVCRFLTPTDCLILKSSEIGGVHIQESTGRKELPEEEIWNSINLDDTEMFEDIEKDAISSDNIDQDKTPSKEVSMDFTFPDMIEEKEEMTVDTISILSSQSETDGIDFEKILSESIDEIKIDDNIEIDEVKQISAENPKTNKVTKKTIKHNGTTPNHQAKSQYNPNNEVNDQSALFKVPEIGATYGHIFHKMDENGNPIPHQNLAQDILGNDKYQKALESGRVNKIKPVIKKG